MSGGGLQRYRTAVALISTNSPGMARADTPMAEYFPLVDVEVGNELFWYIFDGEPQAVGGEIDLRDDLPGLGLTIKESELSKFAVIE